MEEDQKYAQHSEEDSDDEAGQQRAIDEKVIVDAHNQLDVQRKEINELQRQLEEAQARAHDQEGFRALIQAMREERVRTMAAVEALREERVIGNLSELKLVPQPPPPAPIGGSACAPPPYAPRPVAPDALAQLVRKRKAENQSVDPETLVREYDDLCSVLLDTPKYHMHAKAIDLVNCSRRIKEYLTREFNNPYQDEIYQIDKRLVELIPLVEVYVDRRVRQSRGPTLDRLHNEAEEVILRAPVKPITTAAKRLLAARNRGRARRPAALIEAEAEEE